ncbi:MAG TPA: hypothetical protein VI338_01955 [Nitrososphaera sp.]|nr:hypothetical protein [Nitrososphaera sp.]
MPWRSEKDSSNNKDIKLNPTLEELLATSSKDGTRVSNLDFVGSSEGSLVAFLLVPLDDAEMIVSAMKRGIDEQASREKKEMNRVDASVMLHYREDAGGNVRYLFADFIITIKNIFNKTYRILANDNIAFFEALAKSGILGIVPSEISPTAAATDQSSITLVQMPNRQLLEELLTEVKSKVGDTIPKG